MDGRKRPALVFAIRVGLVVNLAQCPRVNGLGASRQCHASLLVIYRGADISELEIIDINGELLKRCRALRSGDVDTREHANHYRIQEHQRTASEVATHLDAVIGD
jgi:hypothetical protein